MAQYPHRAVLAIFFITLPLFHGVLASEPVPEQSFYERITHPDRSHKSAFQGKTFQAGGATFDKSMKTDSYAGVKEFSSKPFAAKVFDGAKKSWMGKLIFPDKKLPQNLQGENHDATKQFASKDLPLRGYAGLDRKSPYATKEDFATRQISIKGKAQGGIDNDQHLREAIKKGLSVDDVRKLLNKAP
ncbi:MAG: hypothetical protein WCP60_02500 [bacterium]